jgi:hypothetical protein
LAEPLRWSQDKPHGAEGESLSCSDDFSRGPTREGRFESDHRDAEAELSIAVDDLARVVTEFADCLRLELGEDDRSRACESSPDALECDVIGALRMFVPGSPAFSDSL